MKHFFSYPGLWSQNYSKSLYEGKVSYLEGKHRRNIPGSRQWHQEIRSERKEQNKIARKEKVEEEKEEEKVEKGEEKEKEEKEEEHRGVAKQLYSYKSHLLIENIGIMLKVGGWVIFMQQLQKISTFGEFFWASTECFLFFGKLPFIIMINRNFVRFLDLSIIRLPSKNKDYWSALPKPNSLFLLTVPPYFPGSNLEVFVVLRKEYIYGVPHTVCSHTYIAYFKFLFCYLVTVWLWTSHLFFWNIYFYF